jgi:hypothetical protein
MWRNRYELVAEGQLMATFEGRAVRGGGTLCLGGRNHEIRANVWSSRFELADETGVAIAGAERLGRKHWTVQAGERTYQFQRAAWRSEQVLIIDGRPAGFVRKKGGWGRDAVADLPGLPTLLQAFVVTVVLCMWEAQASSAAAGGAAGVAAVG